MQYPACRVTPEWMDTLSCQQQTVILLATRGPDGIRKDHPCKDITRAYRGTVFRAAMFGRWLEPGEHGDDFMSLRDMRNLSIWDTVVKQYLRSVDELPHHYHLHLMHGAHIIGCYHPENSIGRGWHYFYMKCCDDMHVNYETKEQMDERLDDWERKYWDGHVATP
jgi:hypothetical protein